jgi:hypothetical protein
MSISTSADTLIAETSIDEVKKAIDAAGLVRRKARGDPQIRALLKSAVSPQWLNCPIYDAWRAGGRGWKKQRERLSIFAAVPRQLFTNSPLATLARRYAFVEADRSGRPAGYRQ